MNHNNQINIFDLIDEPQHIIQLAKWHYKEWAILNPGQSLEDRINNMQTYLKKDFIPSMYIAKYNNHLAGSVAIVEHDMVTRKELSPWLASVYVTVELRNKGIGSQLVQHTVRKAKESGIDKLYLFTPDKVDFYKRLGWSVLEETAYHCEPVTIMQICLNN